MTTGLLAMWLISGVLGELPEINISPTAVEFATSDRLLLNALQQPISAEWEHIPLRQVVRRLVSVTKVPVILDRRLDPDREVTADIREEQMLPLLNRLVAEQGGEARQIGHVVYAGPKRSAKIAKTLVALRRSDLQKSGFPGSRVQALVDHQTLAWGDLSRPADLLSQAGKKYSLRIDGLEKIPHDLWGRGAFPHMGATEILTLLLLQYDLTFEWTSGGHAIRLIPIPEKVVLTQTHAPSHGKSPEKTIELWRHEFPNAVFTLHGREIIVTGTAEEQEALSAPKHASGAASPLKGTTPSTDLNLQRFTLQVPEVPLSRLLKKLETPSGGRLSFTFDEEALKKANKKYTLHIYEGAQHSFNSDVSLDRYHKEAAELAWKRTVAFFKENLTGG